MIRTLSPCCRDVAAEGGLWSEIQEAWGKTRKLYQFFKNCRGRLDDSCKLAKIAAPSCTPPTNCCSDGRNQTNPKALSVPQADPRCGYRSPKIRLSLLIKNCRPSPLYSAAGNRGWRAGKGSQVQPSVLPPAAALGAAPSFLSRPPPTFPLLPTVPRPHTFAPK